MKRIFPRDQRMTIVYGILCIVLILVVLQLWLLTATMNAFLGGDEDVIWPAAAARPRHATGCHTSPWRASSCTRAAGAWSVGPIAC